MPHCRMAFVVVDVVPFYLADRKSDSRLSKSKNLLFFLHHWKNESPINMMKNERKLSSSGKTMNHKTKINQIYKFNKKNWHFCSAKVFYNWTSKKTPNFLENIYSTCFLDSFCLFVCLFLSFSCIFGFFVFFIFSLKKINDKKGFGVESSFKNKNVESSVDHKMKTYQAGMTLCDFFYLIFISFKPINLYLISSLGGSF